MIESEELRTRTLADEYLPGYAGLFQELQRTAGPSADLAEALEAEASRHLVPVPATRGITTPFAALCVVP